MKTPFEDRTGRGVKIAVIDSGVSVPHPHIGTVLGGITIDEAGETSGHIDNYADRIGHGTAVMAAIMEKAPDAEYFAVRVFQSSLRTKIEFLLRAIEWSIEQRVHLINLSLGTSNPAHAERFAPLIARAAEAGTILISAASALPGSMPSVLSVTEDRDCPRDQYRCVRTSRGLEFSTSGYPRPIPGVPPEHNLNGISFAVANMTGFAARACEGLKDRNYESVCAELWGRHSWRRAGL
jgi:subtilisin family serine protease